MSLARLSRRLDRVADRLTSGVQRFVAILGQELAEELVPATPVDTGYARGNWRPSLNAPSPVPVSVLDPTGAATIARITVTARQFRVGDTLFLVNRAPYIGRLNAGSSPQAPAGFVQESIVKARRNARSRAAREGLL